MKKLAFFAALAAVAVAGCNKQEIENPVDSGRSIVVKVTAENNPTRGDYAEDGKFLWTDGDQIGVKMYAEEGYDYTPWMAPLKLTDGAGTVDGTFAYDGTLDDYVHYGVAAFYPYDGTSQPASNVGGDDLMYFYLPASIDYKEGVNRMMLVGAIEQDATDIKLYQAGAGIQISLKDVPARATKVSLTVEGKSIANIWPAIAPDKAGSEAANAPSGGESTVTYNIPTADGVRDMVFTFAVPVQDYAGARLTVTVADNGGTIWTKGGSVKTSPGRGEILAMPELTVKDPASKYYLVGYLNGADYFGYDYPFVDGKLMTSFTQDSYVYIINGCGTKYWFPDYVQTQEGTLYLWEDQSATNGEKMKVPADKITFTLVDNGDNSLTLSYLQENLEEGYFIYGGLQYSIVNMKDGKWWMAQNLAYLPEGYTPATSLTDVTAGVFAPIQVNEAHTAAEFNPDLAATNGYLYQAEVALGLNVGDLQSVEQAQALEGAQGICPKGWHIPTLNDIIGLVGKSVGATTNTSAPYFNGADGSIVLLNEDGFNMDAFGAISIQDNTKTTGTFMGWASGYPDKLSSGMFCGSTYAGVIYNTSGDATSGVKNPQFYGFMPMTNKASEASYTCNGTKVSYRIAGPVRCVRD